MNEVDTEPFRGQLQQESTDEFVQKLIEQADNIRAMHAALDRSSQQSNQCSKSCMRRFSSSSQNSREKSRNPLWDKPAQQSKSVGQRTMRCRVSKSSVPVQSIGSSRCRQGLSQMERRIVPVEKRLGQATLHTVPAAASAVEATGPRIRSRKPLGNT